LAKFCNLLKEKKHTLALQNLHQISIKLTDENVRKLSFEFLSNVSGLAALKKSDGRNENTNEHGSEKQLVG
jgi:hypothetical protein